MTAYLGYAAGYSKRLEPASGPRWYVLRENERPTPVSIGHGYLLSVSPTGQAIAISTDGLGVISDIAPAWDCLHRAVLPQYQQSLHWLPGDRCIVHSDKRGFGPMFEGVLCNHRLSVLLKLDIPSDAITFWQRGDLLYCLVGDDDAWAVIKRGLDDSDAWQPHASGEGRLAACSPSPDGSKLAWIFEVTDDDRCRLVIADTDDMSEIDSTLAAPYPVAWSLDSQKVGFVPEGYGGIGILNLSENVQHIEYPDNDLNPEISPTVISFSSNGRSMTCDPRWLDQTAYSYEFESSRWIRLEPDDWPKGWMFLRAL